MRRIAWFLAAVLILLCGCLQAQMPKYSEPLADIAPPVGGAKFRHVTLGVVLNDNTRKAIDYLQANQRAEQLGSLGLFSPSRASLEDSDPHYVTKGILNDAHFRLDLACCLVADFLFAVPWRCVSVLLLDSPTRSRSRRFG